MRVKDLMEKEVLTVKADDLVEDLLDALVGKHIHGAPVVDESGKLVGIVSQLDIYFGTMTRSGEEGAGARGKKRGDLKVGEIMTAPAVSVGETTKIPDLCKMMHKLRIHRVPVVRQQKVIGMVSSLDICAAVARGDDLGSS
jgi:CBS domain-containing protein